MPDKNVKTTHEYDDILNIPYPLATADRIKHPRMSNADRAKIFAPFSALKGYEEAIAQKERIVVPKTELTEDATEALDRKIKDIIFQLSRGVLPVVSIIYFEKECSRQNEDCGSYIQFTGKVVKISESSRILQIVDRKIPLDDIRSIDMLL